MFPKLGRPKSRVRVQVAGAHGDDFDGVHADDGDDGDDEDEEKA
jgi:hypothetical protein